ncbi:hypothetical protein ACVIRO_006045 [Rhizobium ruizarguesonis]
MLMLFFLPFCFAVHRRFRRACVLATGVDAYGGNRRNDCCLFLFHRIRGWPRRVRGGCPSSCPRGWDCSRAINQRHCHDVELSTWLHCSGNVPTRIYRWLYGDQVLLKPSGISRPSETTWERNQTLWSSRPGTCAQWRSAISPVEPSAGLRRWGIGRTYIICYFAPAVIVIRFKTLNNNKNQLLTRSFSTTFFKEEFRNNRPSPGILSGRLTSLEEGDDVVCPTSFLRNGAASA